jgi:hypothetical protein
MKKSADEMPSQRCESSPPVRHNEAVSTPETTGSSAAGAGQGASASTSDGHGWTLLTSHGRVLLLIARDPGLRVRDLADRAQISERAAAGIVKDLEQAGYISKIRNGRRNRYVVHDELAFRHPAEANHPVRELIEIFTGR